MWLSRMVLQQSQKSNDVGKGEEKEKKQHDVPNTRSQVVIPYVENVAEKVTRTPYSSCNETSFDTEAALDISQEQTRR